MLSCSDQWCQRNLPPVDLPVQAGTVEDDDPDARPLTWLDRFPSARFAWAQANGWTHEGRAQFPDEQRLEAAGSWRPSSGERGVHHFCDGVDLPAKRAGLAATEADWVEARTGRRPT